jgi:hypothetical protein
MLAQLLAPLRGRRAAPAELRVEGIGTLPSVVEGQVDGARVLRLACAPPVATRFLHRRPATLLRPGEEPEEGVLVAVPGPGGAVDPARVQFLRGALPSQRRSFVRVATTVPLAILNQPFGSTEPDAWTIDLSASGVLLSGLDAGGPGDRLRVRLALPRADAERPLPVVAGAAIVRVTSQGLRAVRLDVLDAADRERLAAYVAQRQRALTQPRRRREGLG